MRLDKGQRLNKEDLDGARRATGQTRSNAERMNLASMIPCTVMASIIYCLTNPGKVYVVYQPEAGNRFIVDLHGGSYRCEWFIAEAGETTLTKTLTVTTGRRTFESPTKSESVRA